MKFTVEGCGKGMLHPMYRHLPRLVPVKQNNYKQNKVLKRIDSQTASMNTCSNAALFSLVPTFVAKGFKTLKLLQM
eukprot:1588250-Amphidinium_carterae.2